MKSKLVSLLTVSAAIFLLFAGSEAQAEYYMVNSPGCDSCSVDVPQYSCHHRYHRSHRPYRHYYRRSCQTRSSAEVSVYYVYQVMPAPQCQSCQGYEGDYQMPPTQAGCNVPRGIYYPVHPGSYTDAKSDYDSDMRTGDDIYPDVH